MLHSSTPQAARPSLAIISDCLWPPPSSCESLPSQYTYVCSFLENQTAQQFAQPSVRSMSKRRREEFFYEPGKTVPRDVTCIIIPGSVRVLPAEAFQDNSSLEEVVFEEGVMEVRERAFSNCMSLRRVHLTSTLLRIERVTFFGCILLRELNVPEGTTEIGPAEFAVLSSLEYARLPSTLNAIGDSVFGSCVFLKKMIFPEGI